MLVSPVPVSTARRGLAPCPLPTPPAGEREGSSRPSRARPRGGEGVHRLRSRRAARTARAAVLTLPALLLALLGAACSADVAASGSPAGDGSELTVHRGDLTQRLLLTGELRAERAEQLKVPQASVFQVQVQWIAEDGATVEAGDPVVEFDNAQFATQIEEKRSAIVESENERSRFLADAAAREADLRFRLREREADLEKARLEADVPRDLLPLSEHQERQLALERAEVELEKVGTELAAEIEKNRAEAEIRRIAVDKARRELTVAEEGVRELALAAPRSGVLVVADHPWERRKIQEGDTLWVGMTVAEIPELESLEVEATLSDVDDGKVAAGMPVTVSIDAFPDLELPGEVIEIAPMAREVERSSNLRSFTVRVALDEVDVERLRPGMSAKVEVRPGSREDVLLAPRHALDLAAEPPRARLASGDPVEVALGPCDALACVVEAGLEEGQRLAPFRGGPGENGAGGAA